MKSDKPAVQGGRSAGRVGSETKPRLERQSRTLSPHPDSSEALCWIMIPQCIATASVLSFPISLVPKAHMETVESHCVTVYAKSLSSLHHDLGLLRSPLPSLSQMTLVGVLLFKKVHHLMSEWLKHGQRSFSLSFWDGKLRSEGCAVILFGRAAHDKHSKKPPQSLCIPLTNFDFADCTNNWVRKWLRLLSRFHACRSRSLKEATACQAQHFAENDNRKKSCPGWLMFNNVFVGIF